MTWIGGDILNERNQMTKMKYDYIASQSKKASRSISKAIAIQGKTWEEWMNIFRFVCFTEHEVMEMQREINRLKSDREYPDAYDHEYLKSKAMGKMNRTLNSGKLTRIASMDIEHQDKQFPSNWYKWENIINDIFKDQEKSPNHGAIVGKEGSGKTYLAVWLTEIIRGWRVISNINMTTNKAGKNMKIDYCYAKKMSDVLKLAKESPTEKSIFILDESGIHWSYQDYATKKNKQLGKLLRLCRKQGIVFILIDQLYRTLPRDILERNPIIIQMKHRNIQLSSKVFQGTFSSIKCKYMNYQSKEMPTFKIDVNIDKILEE
jgi:hypothetical protein